MYENNHDANEMVSLKYESFPKLFAKVIDQIYCRANLT